MSIRKPLSPDEQVTLGRLKLRRLWGRYVGLSLSTGIPLDTIKAASRGRGKTPGDALKTQLISAGIAYQDWFVYATPEQIIEEELEFQAKRTKEAAEKLAIEGREVAPSKPSRSKTTRKVTAKAPSPEKLASLQKKLDGYKHNLERVTDELDHLRSALEGARARRAITAGGNRIKNLDDKITAFAAKINAKEAKVSDLTSKISLTTQDLQSSAARLGERAP